MEQEKIDLKDELNSLRCEFNFSQKIYCNKEQNKKYAQLIKEGSPLPEGVYQLTLYNGDVSTNEFYTIYDGGLSDKEKEEYNLYQIYKICKNIETIKYCVVFFTVLAIISLVLGVIAALILFIH